MLSIRSVFPGQSSRRDLPLLLSSRWAAGWFKTIKFFEGILPNARTAFSNRIYWRNDNCIPM
jgi:hypothetical protein